MDARLVVVMMAIALSGMVGASEKSWMCPQMEMELFRVHAMRDDEYYGVSQRHYRLKFADSYYGELAHYGLLRLAWADVRRTRN